jgi:hypothetical protein
MILLILHNEIGGASRIYYRAAQSLHWVADIIKFFLPDRKENKEHAHTHCD